MASENTVSIDFTADTADFSQNLGVVSDDLESLYQQNQDGLTAITQSLQSFADMSAAAAKEAQAPWDAIFDPISNAFSSSIDGMVRGTQTLDQAVRLMAQNIVAEYANSAAQSTLGWIEGEAQKTLATESGNAARTSSTQGAAVAGLAAESASNQESVVGNAWSAAAAVYNNVAQIPYVGWILAPAAAATAATAVLAFGGNIPSAAGGWVVPNDTMAMVHENEMILPAHLSQGLAGMIAAGQGGGGHTFNNTFNVQAGGGISAQQLPDMIVRTMTKALRNGQFGGMRTV